jgi:antitoxin (DNA-binding transcriptional repressor) of toxin-antitoxin stability system
MSRAIGEAAAPGLAGLSFLAPLTFSSYMSLMETMAAAKARANLSALLRKALDGQEIGIVCNGRIVALRPVEVTATDYAGAEYGITGTGIQKIAANLHAKAKSAFKTRKARSFDGDIEKAIGD